MEQSNKHGYEMVFITQPNLGDEGVGALNERLVQTIVAQGGEMQSTENWGKRNLAYRIGRYTEGHYILNRYIMPPAGADELERLLRFNENVIRYLVIRTDE
jgi:small subunit ribosomal protein S6